MSRIKSIISTYERMPDELVSVWMPARTWKRLLLKYKAMWLNFGMSRNAAEKG